MDLEKRIDSYITLIDYWLQTTESEKEKLLLFSDVRNIVSVIMDNYLTNDIPESFVECLESNVPISPNLYDYASSLFWKNYRSMYETNADICDLTYQLPSKRKFQPLISKWYSFNKALDIVQLFFRQYDKDIYEYFLFLRKNNFIYRTNLSDDSSHGITLGLSVSEDSFVAINRFTCDINLLATIAHEVIHSYIFHIAHNLSYDEVCRMKINSLSEVYSYFIELALADYLQDIWGENRDIKIIKNAHFNCLVCSLKNFKASFDRFNLVLPDYNTSSYVFDETLAYGLLLSYHYFDSYLEDREKTKDNILNLVVDSKDYDKRFLLNNYGISEINLPDPWVIRKHL